MNDAGNRATTNNVTNFKQRVSRNQYIPLTEKQKEEFAEKFSMYLNKGWEEYK